jgi:branched-chain amino acid transport system permease protein
LILPLQLFVNGIVLGSVYAVIGLSFGLIFNTTGVYHFAHGAVYAAAAYSIYVLAVPAHLPLPVAAVLTIFPAAILGMGCELLIYRPMRRRGAPTQLVLVASFATLLLIDNFLLIVFGGLPLTLSSAISPAVDVGPIHLVQLDLLKLAAALVVFLFVIGYLFRTAAGRAIRAVVSNPTMATVVGVNPDRIYLLAYAVGSALLVPAALVDVSAEGASPSLGLAPLLVATIVVFSGGIRVIPSAAAAGLLLGVIQSLSGIWLQDAWQSTVAFSILILFLLIRPQGLFGSEVRRF